MIYEWGIEDGYGIKHWGARSELEALRWMGVEYPHDPRSVGVRVIKRVNN